jgi:hypothetical protein
MCSTLTLGRPTLILARALGVPPSCPRGYQRGTPSSQGGILHNNWVPRWSLCRLGAVVWDIRSSHVSFQQRILDYATIQCAFLNSCHPPSQPQSTWIDFFQCSLQQYLHVVHQYHVSILHCEKLQIGKLFKLLIGTNHMSFDLHEM